MTNPFAQWMKSERNAAPDLNTVNEDGERMVKIDATWYTEEEAAIERQSRHNWWQAYKDREAAQKAVRDHEREQDNARYRELQSRSDGIMPTSEAQEQINLAYQFDQAKRKGKTVDEGIPYGGLMSAIVVIILALTLFMAISTNF
jgi:hypothetical protein